MLAHKVLSEAHPHPLPSSFSQMRSQGTRAIPWWLHCRCRSQGCSQGNEAPRPALLMKCLSVSHLGVLRVWGPLNRLTRFDHRIGQDFYSPQPARWPVPTWVTPTSCNSVMPCWGLVNKGVTVERKSCSKILQCIGSPNPQPLQAPHDWRENQLPCTGFLSTLISGPAMTT